jgi:hypothetical protein
MRTGSPPTVDFLLKELEHGVPGRGIFAKERRRICR